MPSKYRYEDEDEYVKWYVTYRADFGDQEYLISLPNELADKINQQYQVAKNEEEKAKALLPLYEYKPNRADYDFRAISFSKAELDENTGEFVKETRPSIAPKSGLKIVSDSDVGKNYGFKPSDADDFGTLFNRFGHHLDKLGITSSNDYLIEKLEDIDRLAKSIIDESGTDKEGNKLFNTYDFSFHKNDVLICYEDPTDFPRTPGGFKFILKPGFTRKPIGELISERAEYTSITSPEELEPSKSELSERNLNKVEKNLLGIKLNDKLKDLRQELTLSIRRINSSLLSAVKNEELARFKLQPSEANKTELEDKKRMFNEDSKILKPGRTRENTNEAFDEAIALCDEIKDTENEIQNFNIENKIAQLRAVANYYKVKYGI